MESIGLPTVVWRSVKATGRYLWYLSTMFFRPYRVGDLGFGMGSMVYEDRVRKLLIDGESVTGEYDYIIYANRIYDFADHNRREPRTLPDERPDLPPPPGFARVRHRVLNGGLVRSEQSTLSEELGLVELDAEDRDRVVQRTVWVLESTGARVLVLHDR